MGGGLVRSEYLVYSSDSVLGMEGLGDGIGRLRLLECLIVDNGSSCEQYIITEFGWLYIRALILV